MKTFLFIQLFVVLNFLELNHRFQHAFIDMEKSKLHPGDIGDAAVSATTSGLNGKLGLILKY